jgi:uncharacterized protein (TIGR03067 family)
MKRVLVLGLVIGLAGLVAARAEEPDPEPPVKDKSTLMRGRWELTGIEIGGMKLPLPLGKGTMGLKFERTSLTISSMGMDKKGAWKIDPRKNPKTIDLTSKDDGKTTLGIYKLDKDELTIALSQPGQARPKDFKDGQIPTIILKRVKKDQKKK